MRILADARWRGQHGIGRFALEVLQRIGPYRAVPATLPILHPLEPLWLMHTLRHFKPSVYFSPGFNPPLHSACPTVFAIHDLIHLGDCEASPVKRLYYQSIVKPAAHRAAALLTVSESSKNEIIDWAGIPSSKVLVVGNGVSEDFTPEGPAYAAGEPYFLYVGAFRPHKNVPRILDAFAKSGLAPRFSLMMSGRPDSGTLRRVRDLRLERRVRFIGSPPDCDLAAYYRGATALVAPSLAEGFCLPALEAMACGCPVVAADRGAQRELLDGAGIYVDPEDTEDVQRGMHDATQPQRRHHAIAAGYGRAAAFSWDATGAKVREALESATQ